MEPTNNNNQNRPPRRDNNRDNKPRGPRPQNNAAPKGDTPRSGASRGQAVRALKRTQMDAQRIANQYQAASAMKPRRANVIDDTPRLKIIGLGAMDGGGSKHADADESLVDRVHSASHWHRDRQCVLGRRQQSCHRTTTREGAWNSARSG